MYRKHDLVPLSVVQDRVNSLLEERKITTIGGFVPLLDDVDKVSICCHSDTPVSTISTARFRNRDNRTDGDGLCRERSRSHRV